MTAQPSSQFDISPMLNMYRESMELWKKNYESIVKNANNMQSVLGANGAGAPSGRPGASAYEAALLNWHKSGGELFKRFVQNQIELCHFFGNRWEHYLKLPEQLSQCRSLTELGGLQASFLSRFASDYMHESKKLAQPMGELRNGWAGEKSA